MNPRTTQLRNQICASENNAPNPLENLEGKEVVIAGRLMVINVQGKASFGQLQDGEGRILLPKQFES